MLSQDCVALMSAPTLTQTLAQEIKTWRKLMCQKNRTEIEISRTRWLHQELWCYIEPLSSRLTRSLIFISMLDQVTFLFACSGNPETSSSTYLEKPSIKKHNLVQLCFPPDLTLKKQEDQMLWWCDVVSVKLRELEWFKPPAEELALHMELSCNYRNTKNS